jgi:hypothetical protein
MRKNYLRERRLGAMGNELVVGNSQRARAAANPRYGTADAALCLSAAS